MAWWRDKNMNIKHSSHGDANLFLLLIMTQLVISKVFSCFERSSALKIKSFNRTQFQITQKHSELEDQHACLLTCKHWAWAVYPNNESTLQMYYTHSILGNGEMKCTKSPALELVVTSETVLINVVQLIQKKGRVRNSWAYSALITKFACSLTCFLRAVCCLLPRNHVDSSLEVPVTAL